MFGMWQLKGLKLSQIIFKYVKILPAKFDFEEVKQNKVRGLSPGLQNGHVGRHLGFKFFSCNDRSVVFVVMKQHCCSLFWVCKYPSIVLLGLNSPFGLRVI